MDIYQEIKKDPLVADLLVSFTYASINENRIQWLYPNFTVMRTKEYICPDCRDQFTTWSSCLEHINAVDHVKSALFHEGIEMRSPILPANAIPKHFVYNSEDTKELQRRCQTDLHFFKDNERKHKHTQKLADVLNKMPSISKILDLSFAAWTCPEPVHFIRSFNNGGSLYFIFSIHF
jgi:hypothetical protein